jgi:hypothetical protein
MNPATDLARLYRRDLTRLSQEIEAFPNDESLWMTAPGITNPAGNLVLHLVGNLREYVGRQLGGVPYRRDRPLEFSTRGVAKEELLARIGELLRTIPAVIERLSPEALERETTELVLDVPMSSQAVLVHLLAHLSWHLGQIDSLRRVVTGHGAIPLVGLAGLKAADEVAGRVD